MEISIADVYKFIKRESNSTFSEQKRIAFCYIKNNIAYDLYDQSEYIVLLDGKYNANALSVLNNNEEVVRSFRLEPIDKFTKDELNSMRFNYMLAKVKSAFQKK